ncbi:MAG: FAD-binding oxidoreductase [Acidobacteria bacterium]|nr:FAD-binding oxidoreductase [Acidobacteriota bacterium]
MSEVQSPASEDLVAREMTLGSRTIARGLGRSYGDAAQLSGGVVLSNRALGGIGAIAPDGVVTLGAGVSIDELLAVAIPQGWFVPVTPGTRQVTIGGAVAADVHGKNHHRDGSIGDHVLEMRLVTPAGRFSVSPSVEPDLFWATIGGMGLTGVVTTVTLRLIKIETDRILVDTHRHSNLDDVMSAMSDGDDEYRYSVAWVDCMTKGASMGRAILTRGDHATRRDLASASLVAPAPARLRVPFNAPSGLLNPLSIRAFNEVWFRSAPQSREGEEQSLGTFFHPLDGVNDWNRLYGRRGFVQYQFAVADAQAECVVRAIDRLSSSGVASFLAVLKRFGPANHGMLSFPLAGWTLALDLPVGPSALPTVLDDLDEMVIDAGGRVYLAKDSRLNPEAVRVMYPRLPHFLDVKNRIDPRHQLASDLARRLQLVGK